VIRSKEDCHLFRNSCIRANCCCTSQGNSCFSFCHSWCYKINCLRNYAFNSSTYLEL